MIHLHSHNILHRDLALRNILCENIIDVDAKVKISDYAMARIAKQYKDENQEEPNLLHCDITNRKTAENRLCGKPKGTFLFRFSKKQKNGIVVSLIDATTGNFNHFLIEIDSDGHFIFYKKI